MKVAFVTNYNSEDITQWSGTGYFLANALEQQGVKLIRVNCHVNYSLFDRIRGRLLKIWFRKDVQIEREPFYLKRLAKAVEQQLEGVDYDLIFSATSLPISYLDSNKPIAICTDATYDCMINFYPGWKNVSARSIWHGNHAEALAIQKSSLVFYPSDWASTSAVTRYSANFNKIKTVRFGANIHCARNTRNIEELIAKRMLDKKIRLLLVGMDWYRKGIDKAVAVVKKLRKSGTDISLTIIGCHLPAHITLPFYIKHHPFVSKSTEAGMQLLNKCFEEASFFILPTQAECYGVVFCEAASYGLPVITTNVGGVPSVVIDGVTGYCLPPESFVTDAIEKIQRLWQSPEDYRKMSVEAFSHFQTSLNWNVAAKKTVQALYSLIKN